MVVFGVGYGVTILIVDERDIGRARVSGFEAVAAVDKMQRTLSFSSILLEYAKLFQTAEVNGRGCKRGGGACRGRRVCSLGGQAHDETRCAETRSRDCYVCIVQSGVELVLDNGLTVSLDSQWPMDGSSTPNNRKLACPRRESEPARPPKLSTIRIE
jgi:hypothetical protein